MRISLPPTVLRAIASTAAIACLPLALTAQIIDLTSNDVGLAIGDKPRVTGLRINYRDEQLREVHGVNVTLWSPYQPARGEVTGLALGLPVTGARVINGAGVGVFGLGADDRIDGLALGGIGVGAGRDIRGITLGGIGVGSGGNITGITVGGIGVGGAGSLKGFQFGGIGVGSGSEVTGISLGGIGVGAAGAVKGLAIGGIGVGGGGTFTGIGIAGIGVGSASDATGLLIGGIGVGSGGRVNGVALGGIGVGAPALHGLMVGGAGVGGADVSAIVLTAGYFHVVGDRGTFSGGALGSVNRIEGTQHGLTIGLFNYAAELHGAQLGLINVSDNDGHRRVIPLASFR